VVLPQITTWFTHRQRCRHAILHSSGATAHSSRWQPGHHNSSLQWGTCATTTGRLGILPWIVIYLGRATHHVPHHRQQTSRGASREAQHHGLAAPTTTPWRRYPWERKYLQVCYSSMNVPSLLSHPVFKPKPNAHSMCAQESSLHTYRTENGDRITNVSI
jgi:hypothetical protein